MRLMDRDPANRCSKYICTGAWWCGADDGCVGATAAAIRALGFPVGISDTVVTEEGVIDYDSWGEGDDATVGSGTGSRADRGHQTHRFALLRRSRNQRATLRWVGCEDDNDLWYPNAK
jgi:hypothetical protein